MKKLFLMLVLMTMSIGITYAQDLLGKTKTQAKAVVTERIAPKNFSSIGTAPTNGYDKYWYVQDGVHYYNYFNSKGICFLECVATNDSDFMKTMISFYGPNAYSGDHPDYHLYFCKTPEQSNLHEFKQGKISVEVTSTYNQYTGETAYFWFFKPEYKQDVLNFFKAYYN